MGRIVELRCKGYSFDDITLKLKREGVRHRRGKEFREYSKGSVHRMFRSELVVRFLEANEADFDDPRVIRFVIKCDAILRRNPMLQRQLEKIVLEEFRECSPEKS